MFLHAGNTCSPRFSEKPLTLQPLFRKTRLFRFGLPNYPHGLTLLFKQRHANGTVTSNYIIPRKIWKCLTNQRKYLTICQQINRNAWLYVAMLSQCTWIKKELGTRGCNQIFQLNEWLHFLFKIHHSTSSRTSKCVPYFGYIYKYSHFSLKIPNTQQKAKGIRHKKTMEYNYSKSIRWNIIEKNTVTYYCSQSFFF